MAVYQQYSYAEEFMVISTFELKDNDRFIYSEDWSSYGGGFGCEVQGSWRQNGDSIAFYPEFWEENSTTTFWSKKKERQASLRGDQLIFDDFNTFPLRR